MALSVEASTPLTFAVGEQLLAIAFALLAPITPPTKVFAVTSPLLWQREMMLPSTEARGNPAIPPT